MSETTDLAATVAALQATISQLQGANGTAPAPVQQQAAAPMPQYQMAPPSYGQPQQAPPMYGYQPPQQPMAGPMPTPVGVSVPVKVQLQDGSSLRMYIQFPAAAAGNLQALAMACQQMFGPMLDAWQSRQQGGYGNGGGGGGGYGNGGGYGGRGGYGRRW